MSYALELRGVTKRFGDVTAVDAVDLAIPHGEFFSLLGPSGCGKTTTLRMIAGFEEPTEGELLLDGRPGTTIPPFRRNTNLVFQSYALFPHMSVYDNVAFGPRRAGVPRDEERRRVNAVLRTVRMEAYADRLPRALSGGQRQRVALARALVNEPAVLLLDEPLGALDLKLRKEMQIELKHIQREVGISFVYVTHDQEEAMTMSDRIAVMNEGRIEQIGPPEEVYHRPATRFVAEFIGAANLLEVEVIAAPGGKPTRARFPSGLETAVASANRTDATVGSRGVLVLRPEHLVLHAAPPTDEPAVETTIVETIFQGSVVRFELTTPDGTHITALETTRRPAPGGPGDTVWITWAQERAHVVLD
ncbi:MAG TPA: ABC transporter ATP-binding protein [Actinobacteria bacterium]|nr:ABC transporter ATP-binding protein [Actinomycetota bacterium]